MKKQMLAGKSSMLEKLAKNALTSAHQNAPPKTLQKILTRLESRILNKIIGNSRISRRKIAENLNISSNTIKEYLEILAANMLVGRLEIIPFPAFLLCCIPQ